MYRSFRRLAVPAEARQAAQPKTIPAPIRGWVTSENLAAAGSGAAFALDNFFPTKTGIKPRGGKARHATIGGRAATMFAYLVPQNGHLFAADATAIYDITAPLDPEIAPDPTVRGQTGGTYSTEQFTTTGGTFLIAVNGADPLQSFDGSVWLPITDQNVFGLAFDAGTTPFTAGQTVTGGTSGASASIVRVIPGVGNTGVLAVRGITGGPFQNNEALTDGAGGAATADIPSGVTTLATGITGVDTDSLSAVWSHQNRLFFIEAGTMNAWYLPVDSVGGPAEQRALGGVFKLGGSLLFGSTWSRDAGDGMDDLCVLVTTEGEVAVFQGVDPGGIDPGDFDLVGVYRITKPMGKNATMKAGGDLVILTEDGMVPLSAALSADIAALSLSAVTHPIEPEWQRQAMARGGVPWEIAKWVTRNMAVIAIPAPQVTDAAFCFVVNIETGAWCRYTGWDAQTLIVFNDRLFFGGIDGAIFEGEVTGSDDGENIECLCIWHADHLGALGATKVVHAIRSIFTASFPFAMELSISTDYGTELPPFPNPLPLAGEGWDLSLWDVSVWDAPGVPRVASTRWLSAAATGFAIRPQLQITSNSTPPLDAELVSIDVMFETVGVMV